MKITGATKAGCWTSKAMTQFFRIGLLHSISCVAHLFSFAPRCVAGIDEAQRCAFFLGADVETHSQFQLDAGDMGRVSLFLFAQ